MQQHGADALAHEGGMRTSLVFNHVGHPRESGPEIGRIGIVGKQLRQRAGDCIELEGEGIARKCCHPVMLPRRQSPSLAGVRV